ncbi:vacuolar membrane protein-domain-containing protein [Phascolomyces articulosus]|uniref:Vacuolar membrane protein-domain-containing protein n=1 Tax=Phascolomyces articulosus TaxID=60185 RepID=A0AAD5PAM8_9FUNG|nr:vacuolar membrane protein-domain-containing protein [Phascolomyces articulosus]
MSISQQWQTCNEGGGETCELLDGFAILVQLTLVFTALMALGIKRWRERPRRPVDIWALDVSKQFVGAGTIHFLNLGISYLSGRPGNGQPSTNLCVWYFLSLMTDTTIGIAILWFWLRVLEWSLGTFLGLRHLQGGYDKDTYHCHEDNDGQPSFKSMLLPWWKQTMVFVLAEFLMKICIYGLFQIFPSIFDLGDGVLRLIGTDSRYQVVFVMFIFPLFMNAFQFCVIDTIIKGNHNDNNYKYDDDVSTKHILPSSKKNESTNFLQSILIIPKQPREDPHERSPLLPPPA